MTAPVVVGLDDFERGEPLLALAAREAERRATALWLVHAYSGFAVPTFPAGPGRPGFPPEEFTRREAVARLNGAAARVRAGHPDLHVEILPLSGPPAHALADAANGCAASLLVVGGRGVGGFSGQLLGSVSLHVLTLAHCPVLVARGDAASAKGRVMLGVDVAEPVSGPETIAFAFEEAERRGTDLYALNVWEDTGLPYMTFDEALMRQARDAELARNRTRLEAVLAPWAEKHPGVRVRSEALAGAASRLLVESTALVDLLVVGGKVREQGHQGLRIGPLTHTVLHHAHCPVVVVPEH